MNEFLFHVPTILCVAGIGADTTLAVFPASTSHKTVKATEIQSITETNVFGYSENERKSQRGPRKPYAEHSGTRKPCAHRAGIEPSTTIVALARVAVTEPHILPNFERTTERAQKAFLDINFYCFP